MSTQDAFEQWCKSDFPECDLTRLPSGNYRIKSTQDKWDGFLAGYGFAVKSCAGLIGEELGEEA